jgi:transglutaminase-like putative cysteine protease
MTTATRTAASGGPLASGLQRTLLALLASGLGAVPLCTLLSDRGWLVDVWLTMVVALLPALLMRLSRPPGALQIWPGIVLLVPWLTGRFLSDTAWYGVIPTGRTWDRISVLLDNLHDTAQHSVAPVHSTIAIKLAACAMLGLLAALVDLIAVVGRHGALAGVPLLVVYTVAGAVPHRSVGWWLFLAPAIGFLVLLALDARDDRMTWGHRVARPGHSFAQPAAALGGQRIAVFALVVAVVLPFATPSGGTNLVSLLTRNSHGGNGSSCGLGCINPFAALRGQLTRTTPKDLATVTIHGQGSTVPFYLRVNVLPVYTPKGWRPAANHGSLEDVSDGTFVSNPPSGGGSSQEFTAQIKVLDMSGSPAIFANPTAIANLDDAKWAPKDQLLVDASVRSGQSYTEAVNQPDPRVSDLRAAVDDFQDPALSQWVTLRSTIPKQVRALVAKLIRTAKGPYARARAISNYFTDPDNGFQYSLQTTAGDSGSDLVDFLTNKIGYCQQYAAAMAVMLRLADVPARVVLGYTHGVPNASGTFTITTNDAHAWVEAYFDGIGWIPFDPTPATGEPGASTSNLPWAPRGGNSDHAKSTVSSSSSNSVPVHRSTQPTAHAPTPSHATAAGASGVPAWLLAVVVILAIALVLLIPFFVRGRRRHRRLHAADPDALWAELSDTAVDLGYVWSPTRTPRQVVRWLGDAAGDARAPLSTLARAVEAHRYAPPGGGTVADTRKDLRADLTAVTRQLRSGRDRGTRLRAALWPASLGWLRRVARGEHR